MGMVIGVLLSPSHIADKHKKEKSKLVAIKWVYLELIAYYLVYGF